MIYTFFRKFFRICPKLRRIFYSHYNKLLFWANGIQFGRNMQVLDKMYVLGKGKVNIGDDFRFTSGDSINPICRNIRGAIYTVTPLSRIEIGNRVGISSACLWAKERNTIGNDVNIGGDCLIMDNDAHPHDYIQRRAAFALEVGREEYQKSIPTAPIVIEDDVWIGAHNLTHPMLRRVENSYEEIRKSKENLEQILHKSISYFRIPLWKAELCIPSYYERS